MIKLKQDRGITLVTLIIAIIIMIIISSVIIYNASTGMDTKALNSMYNDITILKNRVDIYYAQYQALPVIKIPYTNIAHIKNKNVNDNDNYYVLDLESLENVTLTYGKDYKEYKQLQNTDKTDLYIINEKSHTIYYVEGITLDNINYYTIPNEYSKVEISTKCNPPKLGMGMTPVKWNGTEFIKTKEYDAEWYDYIDTSLGQERNSKSKWANAKTEDESMWVWIPRFAYKITYVDTNDKSQGGTIDIVFLKNNTNYDFYGNDVTNASYIDENGIKGAYIVHPAFQDGTKNGFANGEWDEEITGFWMAKFEAGYAGEAGNINTAQDSKVEHTTIYGWNGSIHTNVETNYYGERSIGSKIKYPVFQANKPSMNCLGISDSYNLSKSLSTSGNPYGFKNVDSHLTKNSEWGAVVYLAYSKYGRNGEEVASNNVSVNNENTIYAVTGYGVQTTKGEDTSRNLSILTMQNQEGSYSTIQGQKASTTGNIYGIYDLSGGLWEWTSRLYRNNRRIPDICWKSSRRK